MSGDLSSEYGVYLPKEFRDFKERDVVWLWSHLNAKGEDLMFSYEGGIRSLFVDIGRVLRSKDSPYIYQIRESWMIRLVDDDSLSFINKKDRRMLSFLIDFFSCKAGYGVPLSSKFSFLDDWSYFLLLLDSNDSPLNDKKRLLRDARDIWSAGRFLELSLDWLDEKSEEQSAWLLKQAEKKNFNIDVPGSINSPVNAKERSLKFRCVLDQAVMPSEFKVDFIRDLKRKWKAKVRKKSEERKQVNVLVQEETREGIKRLCDFYGFRSGGEVVDKLVRDAIEDNKNFVHEFKS